MKNIKKTIILILALCSFTGAFSQTKTIIRGKVIDQKDKSAVIGATVVESDKQNRVVNGSVTDIDGNFVYQMKNPANSMKVTVIGYQSKAFKPNPLKAVVIELVSSDIELDQVVVTGKVRSDNSLTNIDDRDNASSRVKVDLMDMKDGGITSAADALQGKVAGLDIISASGDPGSGSQIVIRGLSSIGNNKPLIVIDGITQDNVPSSFDLSSSDAQDIGNMINIALQDIKSIEVLKDAASTAVYGSKGADGVLLIETNRGKMGKVQFDYTYKNSVNFQPRAVPLLNGDEYVTLQLEEWHNARGVFDLPREIAYDKDYPDFYNYSANTDWLGAITQNSVTNDHYFKISGGGEKTRYFTSFSYVDEGGTTINTGKKSFSTRVNLDYFLSKKLTFTVQFNYSNNKRDGNISINDRNIRQMAYIKAPNMSIMEHDADGNLTGEYFTRNFDKTGNYQGSGYDYYNPVAVAKLGKSDESENSLENSFKLKYTLKDWLIFKETASFQYYGRKSNSFLPYNAVGSNWYDWTVNKAEEGNKLYSSFKTESQLVFYVPFKTKNHELTGATSWSTTQSTDDGVNIQSNRNPSINLQDPAVGAQINWISSSLVEKSDVGALLNLNYKYKDRYMVQATARADGNSAFGSVNRWGLFKGVGAAWRFSSEKLFENSKNWLSESKLRASWGTSGRPPSDEWPHPTYPRFAIYKTTNPGSYIQNPAVVPTSIQLDNLKWESIMQTDIGLELNLFKDRLYIEGDIYRKLTTDLLFGDYKIPLSSGFDKLVFLNGGELANKGWELMTNGKIIRTKDMVLSVDFNISQNVNSFTKLPENFNNEKDISINNGVFPKRIVEGEPIGSFFGFRYKGVYASDADAVASDATGNMIYDGEHNPIPMSFRGIPFKGGDSKYEDINHDGKIDLNDVVYIGDSNPDFIGGFGSSLRYKQFDISFQFHYRVGFDIINSTALNTEGMNGRNNQSKAVLNRWRVQGQNEVGMLPRALMDGPANNLGSDRYVERGDFLRLNNINLKYQFSPALCNKLNLQSASFSLSARKLYTLTNYSGQDPEVSQNAADPFWIGEDKANTPPPKMVTLSFSVGF